MSGPTKDDLLREVQVLQQQLKDALSGMGGDEHHIVRLQAENADLKRDMAKLDAQITEDGDRTLISWLAENWRIASVRFRAVESGRPDPYAKERAY